MTRSTSSMGEVGSLKSPSSHIDSVSRSSPSVFTITDENNTDNHKETDPVAIISKILGTSDYSRNTAGGISDEANPSNVNAPSATTGGFLPPIVIHKQPHDTNQRKTKTISKELVIGAINTKSEKDGDALDQNVGFKMLNENDGNEIQLRKISCCYGFGVFLILFSGLAALTSLVIYAGFWYLLQQEVKNVLLIGTGHGEKNPLSGIQTFSLPMLGKVSKCLPPPYYPIPVSGAQSVFWHRQVIVCGGQLKDGTALTKCYQLKKQNGAKWKFDDTSELRKPRAFSSSITIRPSSKERKEWWITGGRDGHNTLQRGTERYRDNQFISGPNLPLGISHHCLVELSPIKTMVIGGQTIPNKDDWYDRDEREEDDLEENLFSNKVWVFDWSTTTWKRMKRLTEGRHSHSCSQTLDKKLVVVAGGLTGFDDPSLTIEVFDVATEEWKLLEDSKLPWQVIGVPFIHYQGVPTLLRSSSIQKLKNDNDDDYGDTSEEKTNDKSSNKLALIQLLNKGNFKEISNFSASSMVKVRSYGVILVVPAGVVCF